MPRFDHMRPDPASWQTRATRRNVGIGGLTLLPGGAIQENWGFRARFVGGPFDGEHDIVLRTDAPTGVPSSLGRIEEFAVLQAVFAAGVTVPEPLWACADPAVLGKPFFVMRRIAGTAQGRQITPDPALEPALPAVAARLAQELARLQTIRPPCARSRLSAADRRDRSTSPHFAPISTVIPARGRCSNGRCAGSRPICRSPCRRCCAIAISAPATICSTATR